MTWAKPMPWATHGIRALDQGPGAPSTARTAGTARTVRTARTARRARTARTACTARTARTVRTAQHARYTQHAQHAEHCTTHTAQHFSSSKYVRFNPKLFGKNDKCSIRMASSDWSLDVPIQKLTQN